MHFRLEKAVLGLPNLAIVGAAIASAAIWVGAHADDIEDTKEKIAPIIADVKILAARQAVTDTKQAVTDQRLKVLEEAVREFQKVQTESFKAILERLPKPD